jgi:glycosyltransferase involved in cell wall biosynthesis
MTQLSRTGFVPKRERIVRSPALTSCDQITLVIPVLNNQPIIDRFLAALIATHPPAEWPAEVLVVDNGSTPPIAVAASPLPARVLQCSEQGPANARN